MLTIALMLLQVAAPETAEPAAEPAPAVEATAAAPADAPDEPKMKRVCRKVIDSRVGTLAGRTLKCKYVPADSAEVASN